MPTDDDPISDDDATSTSSETDGVFGTGVVASDAPLVPFSEVLSGVMDDQDLESTGELDLPEEDDGIKLRPAKSDPGFDGWLDDDDPYAALDGDDDAAAEIADWVAFTSGSTEDVEDTGETDVVVDVTDDAISDASIVSAPALDAVIEIPDVEDVEVEAVDAVVDDPADAEDEPHEDTIEFFLDDSAEDGPAADGGTGDDDELDDEPAAMLDVEDDSDEDDPGEDDLEEDDPDQDGPGYDTNEDAEAVVNEPGVAVAVGAALGSPSDSVLEPQASTAHEDESDVESEDEPENGSDEEAKDEPEATPKPVDLDELLVLPVIPIAAAATRAGAPEPQREQNVTDADDDTGEVPIIGEAGSFDANGPDEDNSIFDFNDFDDDQYLNKATREHQDLAAAMVAADSEDTQQVALSAAIPGLDSGVVGFDDVVAAGEGDAAVPAPPRQASDLLVRVGTGIALVAAFLLSLLWRPAITVLALAAFVVAAGEFYSALMHRRYKPMSVFGFVGIIAAGIGAVVWGVIAIPIAFGLLATVILLYGAVSQRRVGAVSGFALTVLVAGWIGGFGSFAFPIIAAEDFQILVLTVVAIVALVDITAYFVGSSIGRRPLAPKISPKKTIEGFVGGTFMAFLAGAGASFFVEAIDLPTGLVLGAAVAVFAPLGDLAVSVMKRSLDIKDMGSILPGHGGLLDRIDAIIAVVPAAWAVFVWAGLL